MSVDPVNFGVAGFAFPVVSGGTGAVFPAAGVVLLGTTYGPTGADYTGTAVLVVVPGTASGVTAAGRNDLIAEAVRAKVDAALPDDWNVYARRDLKVLPADLYPMVMVDALPTVELEEETDNQVVTGYQEAVVLLVKEAAAMRTDSDLTSLRRVAQQAVYTTDYATLRNAGLAVETVLMAEDCPPPQLGKDADQVTWVGFVVTIGILESREVAQ